MGRSIPVFVVACLVLAPTFVHADKPNNTPRPTVFLRTKGQFITQTAEREATLFDLQGQAVRVFVVPSDFSWIHLSADEKLVRLAGYGEPETLFDIKTGAIVSGAAFVLVAAPAQPAFRYDEICENDEWRFRQLELIDSSTNQKVRRLGSFRRVYTPIWLASGEADVPVLNEEKGQDKVGVFRFDPKTGSFVELFWCPITSNSSVEFLEHLTFDPERRIGVKTSRRFQTTVYDLRTGNVLFTIDNSTNYHNPYAHVWSVPFFGMLTNAEMGLLLGVLLALLTGLVVGFRFVWKIVRRRTKLDIIKSLGAEDYGDLPPR